MAILDLLFCRLYAAQNVVLDLVPASNQSDYDSGHKSKASSDAGYDNVRRHLHHCDPGNVKRLSASTHVAAEDDSIRSVIGV